MSVAFDAASNAGTFQNVSSASWTHTPTPGISNPCAIVSVCWAKLGSTTPTVTYDGVAMTACGYADNADTPVPMRARLFQLTGIDTSAGKTILVDWGGVSGNFGNAGCQTYSGVNQATPVGTAVTDATTLAFGVSTTTNTLNITAGDMGVDTVAVNTGSTTFSGNRTLRFDGAGNGYEGFGQDTTTSGSVAMTVSWLGSNGMAHVSNTILAAASAALNPYYYRNIAGHGG